MRGSSFDETPEAPFSVGPVIGANPSFADLLRMQRPEAQPHVTGGAGGEDAGEVQSSSKGEALKEEMDEILDEIDSVLEENAEEFIKSYVQKGGE